MQSVKLDLPLNAKLTKLKNLLDKESQPDVEELVSLLELKQLFDSNDIKENEIKKKRNYIKSQLEATNSGINLNTMDSDILYDETRVHFEKIDSLVKFSNKLEKYKLLHTNVYFRFCILNHRGKTIPKQKLLGEDVMFVLNGKLFEKRIESR